MAEDEELDLDQEEEGGERIRPFWSGTISFGLVSVPVDLYPATRPKRVALRMLSPDGVPLARRFYDERHDRDIERDEIVRGFEMDDGEMVLVTDAELEALEPDKSRDIDLRRFVPAESLDPRYFNRGYFLAPSGESTKAYRLLAAVMEETKRAGIATFVMRGKEYLVAIFAENGILHAETLRFADELRKPQDVGLPDVRKPKAADVKTYARAIDRLKKQSLAEKELRDAWAERLLKLVERKAKKGEDTVELPEEVEAPADSDVIDLMEVLKRSLQGAKERRSERSASSGRARKSSGRSDAKSGSSGRSAAKKSGAKNDLSALSKEELYERAQELDIPGRSSMSKAQLVRALERAG
jgi:DNA end-binding protein Ku